MRLSFAGVGEVDLTTAIVKLEMGETLFVLNCLAVLVSDIRKKWRWVKRRGMSECQTSV